MECNQSRCVTVFPMVTSAAASSVYRIIKPDTTAGKRFWKRRAGTPRARRMGRPCRAGSVRGQRDEPAHRDGTASPSWRCEGRTVRQSSHGAAWPADAHAAQPDAGRGGACSRPVATRRYDYRNAGWPVAADDRAAAWLPQSVDRAGHSAHLRQHEKAMDCRSGPGGTCSAAGLHDGCGAVGRPTEARCSNSDS